MLNRFDDFPSLRAIYPSPYDDFVVVRAIFAFDYSTRDNGSIFFYKVSPQIRIVTAEGVETHSATLKLTITSKHIFIKERI